MDERAPLRHAAAFGALIAATSVGAGAFGTHSLRNRISAEALAQWGTGVQYAVAAGIGVVALAAAGAGLGAKTARPAYALGGGALVFQATLFGLALGGPRWLGAVAPVGGALMIGGWLAGAFALARAADG